jgi:hypothetical protein
MKLATTLAQNKEQLYTILTEIQDFDLEERKQIQLIIVELYSSCPDQVVSALFPKRVEIAHNLVDKYSMPGMAGFSGAILRLFARSSVYLFPFIPSRNS